LVVCDTVKRSDICGIAGAGGIIKGIEEKSKINVKEKAERIFKAVDKVYTVPAYLEDKVKQAIILELGKMKREED